MEIEDKKCKKCGLCCEENGNGSELDKNLWIGGKLTWEQKQQLLEERKKYSTNEKGCAMLYFKGGKAHCLVAEMCGSDARDKNCIDYPFGEKCLRENNENHRRK